MDLDFNSENARLNDILIRIKEIINSVGQILPTAKEKSEKYKNLDYPVEEDNYNNIFTIISQISTTINNAIPAIEQFLPKIDKYIKTIDTYQLKLDNLARLVNKNKLDYGLQGQLTSSFSLKKKRKMDQSQKEVYDELMSHPPVKVGTYGRGGKQRTNKKRKTNKRKHKKNKSRKVKSRR
jgi:hypothetical protein